MYNDFLLPSRRGGHGIYLKLPLWIWTPLSLYTNHLYLDFLLLHHFYILPQPHHVMASHPSPGDNQLERRLVARKNTGPTKMASWNSIINLCTRALHSFQSIFRICHNPSAAQGHLLPPSYLPIPTFHLLLPSTPSNHMVLIHSFHIPKASQYSLICSTQLPFYSRSSSHLFIPNYSFVTLQPNFSNTSSWEHSLFFSSTFHTPHLCMEHFFLNPTLLSTLQCSKCFIPHNHFVYHISFKSPISCHLPGVTSSNSLPFSLTYILPPFPYL